eukprot:CAMPEP_0114555438 /NCGR_PEP_ID=MMETSP0114-20121206/8749_1 /TAXON_ID=31324 /ORGANISM="Goniomonas sp, Strain m" /LENGTH=414 /DNA_ID=CAMNT_0001740563 /DNA_START=125 /DNA_END=1369 /DNA_ORIENTATION=-
MRQAALVLILFLAAGQAEIFSGDIQSLPEEHVVYVGKFCLGVGQSSINIVANGDSNVQFALFDDQKTSWPTVESTPNCTDQLAARRPLGPAPLNLPLNTPGEATEKYVRWWYFTFINCGGPVTVSDYTLTLINSNGSQLSYQQQGLPELFCVFFVFLLVASLGLFTPFGRKYLQYSMSSFFVTALVLEMFSRMFLMTNYYTIKNSGREVNVSLGLGYLLDLASQCFLLGHAMLVAFGWHVRAMKLMHRLVLLVGVAVYLVVGFVLILWGSTVQHSWWFVDTLLVTPLGTFLTVYRIVLAILFVVAFNTIALPGESDANKVLWMRKFMVISFIWQVLYCLFSLIGHGVASYDQGRVTWGLLCTVDFLYLLALAFMVSPGRVGEWFGSWMDEGVKTSGLNQSFVETPDTPQANSEL